MKVGLYFDLRVPPDSGQDPARVYAHALEMCEEAEHGALDSVWFSEHHGFDDGYLPQPLTFAAAAAARTSRVRLGTALVVTPLHNTVELAEQAAVVDLISDGRLDLGIGAGYRESEFALFGADPDSRFATMARQVETLREMWASDRVTPAPVQSEVPIWIGTGGEVGARRAGRLGANLLFLAPELLPAYRHGRGLAGLDPNDGRMGGPIFALPCEDPERDLADLSTYVARQQDSYRRHHAQDASGRARGTGPEAYDVARGNTRPLDRPGAFWLGTPEDLAARVDGWLGAHPVDTAFLWASVGGMPEHLVERNVALIINRLAPLLRAIGETTSAESTTWKGPLR